MNASLSFIKSILYKSKRTLSNIKSDINSKRTVLMKTDHENVPLTKKLFDFIPKIVRIHFSTNTILIEKVFS